MSLARFMYCVISSTTWMYAEISKFSLSGKNGCDDIMVHYWCLRLRLEISYKLGKYLLEKLTVRH